MTDLVVKTVIICTLKFLKNGVCFVLFWQRKMSLPSLRRVTFAERLSPSIPSFLARPLTLTSSFLARPLTLSLQSLPSLRRETFAERLSPSDFRRRNYRPHRLFWLVCWHWRRLHRLYRFWPVGQLSSTMLHFNQAKQFKFQLLYILQCLSSKMLLLSRTIIKPSFNVTVCSTWTT